MVSFLRACHILLMMGEDSVSEIDPRAKFLYRTRPSGRGRNGRDGEQKASPSEGNWKKKYAPRNGREGERNRERKYNDNQSEK